MSSVSTSALDSLDRACAEIDLDGYTTLRKVFDEGAVADMLSALETALAISPDPAIRSEEGAIYAARNILVVWPSVATVWRRPPLLDVLARVLGPGFGLVRVLYFDKPPGQSWALPWHKDLVIAVRDNTLVSPAFRKPTKKSGVPHVEAPASVLESMLTARIHLDSVTPENGPLRVLPGSQRSGKVLNLESLPVRTLYAEAGDVLLIRPLVAHCSNRSAPETPRHRRILHLEFAGGELPDGFAWHDFVSGSEHVKQSAREGEAGLVN